MFEYRVNSVEMRALCVNKTILGIVISECSSVKDDIVPKIKRNDYMVWS